MKHFDKIEKNFEDIQLIRLSEVISITGLSRSSIYGRLNPNSTSFDPTFPRQVKLSHHASGAAAWSLKEIKNWLQSRLNARSEGGK